MRSLCWLVPLFLLALPCHLLAIELTPLILGDTMPGWEDKGEKKTWSIHDGELVCAGGDGDWFGTQRDYTDFIIDLEFKLPPGGNSGVFLRAPATGKPFDAGMEVQILDDADPQYKDIKPGQHCGSLYMIEPAVRHVVKPAGQWNHMRVLADSDYIHVELNDVAVVDTDGAAHPEIFKRSARGSVGLQNHETGVAFRNIRFADLAADRAKRMRWWHEAKFGMFIHWGIYAVRGEGEWVMNFGHIPAPEYEKLAGEFNPSQFDPAGWVSLAKRGGAEYMVLTTKHHDGFAMYNSKVSDYDVVDRTPYAKDPLKMLADECARQHMRLGIYHSILDWHERDFVPAPGWYPADPPASQRDFGRYLDYLQSMLRELSTNYGPLACIWWDGGAEHKTPADKARLSQINRMIRELQPGVIINDRANRLEDYATPEQYIPPTGVWHPNGLQPAWESCMTLTTGNGSFPHMAWWGYDKNEKKFKSPKSCIRILVDVVSKGGNLLLNVGPDAEGRIGPRETAAFEAIGQWLRVNGEAIHGCDASPFKHLSFNGRVTVKGNVLYVHLFEWPTNGALSLPPELMNEVRSARLLAGEEAHVEKKDGAARITLPARAPDPAVSVVAIQLDGPPRVKPYTPSPDAQGRIVLDAIDAEMPLEPGLHFRLEEFDGRIHIGRWVNLADVPTWKFKVLHSGQYSVLLDYAAQATKNPGFYQLSVTEGDDHSTLYVDVQPTSSENDFRSGKVGQLSLGAGESSLSIKPVSITKDGALMKLRRIVLTPANESNRHR